MFSFDIKHVLYVSFIAFSNLKKTYKVIHLNVLKLTNKMKKNNLKISQLFR